MRTALLALAVAGAAVSPAAAQTTPPAAPPSPAATLSRPLPLVVLDARLTYPYLGQDATTAASLQYPVLQLPKHTIGYGFGLHLYPLRGQGVSLGVGGEYVFASATDQQIDINGKPIGLEITRRLQGLSGVVSINFGRREGWSYLSAGLGPLVFDSFYSNLKRDSLSQMTLNVGGGARWFNYDHLAFSMDLRIYLTKPALATPDVAARARKKMLVISGGIAIK